MKLLTNSSAMELCFAEQVSALFEYHVCDMSHTIPLIGWSPIHETQ